MAKKVKAPEAPETGSTHSPGPWAYTAGDAERRASSTVFKANDPDFRIAEVTCEWVNQTQRREDIANAKLIAAAPELLAVCKDYVGILRDIRPLVSGVHAVAAGNLLKTLLAVVAKATA